MYTIYKLAKKRRTPEEIAELPEAIQILTPQQRLVRNILDDSGLKNVILTSRIIKAMGTQIAKVKNLARKAMRGGGNGFKELVKKWDSDNHKYDFKIYFKEVDICQISHENTRLRNLKRKYKENFLNERNKRVRLEEKL